MKQTVVESIIEFCEKQKNNDVSSHRGAYLTIINFCKEQAKEMEKQQQDKNKYSEEDMEQYADYCWKSYNDNRYKSSLSPKEWFRTI